MMLSFPHYSVIIGRENSHIFRICLKKMSNIAPVRKDTNYLRIISLVRAKLQFGEEH